MQLKKLAWMVAPGLCVAIGFSGFARAGGNLVTNGTFSSTGNGQLGYNTTVNGWTNTDYAGSSTVGYNFVFAPNTADKSGTTGNAGALQLWGSNNGGLSTLTYPGNNNIIGMDGAYQASAITQSISGLTVGQQYDVTFEYAGAQQSGFTGITTEKFDVSLGSEMHETATLTNASHSFTGWTTESLIFTATSATETLSFLAIGTPVSPSEPPFVLLSSVDMEAVPEPSALLLMGAGLAGLGIVHLRRRRRAILAAV